MYRRRRGDLAHANIYLGMRSCEYGRLKWSFAKPFYRDKATTLKMVADLLSQTRTLHLFANTVLMLVLVFDRS